MKKYVYLLCIIVFLCGCRADDPVSEQPPIKEEITMPEPSVSTDTEIAEKTEEETAEEVTGIVDTAYFTVELPKSWRETVTVDIGEDIENIYDVSFYEKINFETEGAGHLFTIRIIPEGEDYSFYPSYDVLGSLISVDGTSCHAVALYPTDVQAVVEMEAYFQLFEQIPEVLGAVTWKDASGFVPQK